MKSIYFIHMMRTCIVKGNSATQCGGNIHGEESKW